MSWRKQELRKKEPPSSSSSSFPPRLEWYIHPSVRIAVGVHLLLNVVVKHDLDTSSQLRPEHHLIWSSSFKRREPWREPVSVWCWMTWVVILLTVKCQVHSSRIRWFSFLLWTLWYSLPNFSSFWLGSSSIRVIKLIIIIAAIRILISISCPIESTTWLVRKWSQPLTCWWLRFVDLEILFWINSCLPFIQAVNSWSIGDQSSSVTWPKCHPRPYLRLLAFLDPLLDSLPSYLIWLHVPLPMTRYQVDLVAFTMSTIN